MSQRQLVTFENDPNSPNYGRLMGIDPANATGVALPAFKAGNGPPPAAGSLVGEGYLDKTSGSAFLWDGAKWVQFSGVKFLGHQQGPGNKHDQLMFFPPISDNFRGQVKWSGWGVMKSRNDGLTVGFKKHDPAGAYLHMQPTDLDFHPLEEIDFSYQVGLPPINGHVAKQVFYGKTSFPHLWDCSGGLGGASPKVDVPFQIDVTYTETDGRGSFMSVINQFSEAERHTMEFRFRATWDIAKARADGFFFLSKNKDAEIYLTAVY